MKLLFCGDIMPGGVLPYQVSYVDPGLKAYMQGFDFRVGTLESAIGTGLPFDPVKMQGRQNIVYARDEDFFRVKELGFDVVSLANNHVWDLGEEGLRNTIGILERNGIQYCGAGMDIGEASRPAVLEKDGQRIAVLACCMYGSSYLGHVQLAGKDKAGVNPLDMEEVLRAIEAARKRYDRVVVMPHWGREYTYKPLSKCVTMARQMIDAGADAVLGSHTHQVQPFLKVRGKPVCFSMGNFLFPDFYMYPPRPVWYPEKGEDLSAVKDVVGYPFPIAEPIRQVWNPVSRYGCVVEWETSGKRDRTGVSYVHLSDGNVVARCGLPRPMQKELRKTGRLIQCRPLRVIHRLISRFR